MFVITVLTKLSAHDVDEARKLARIHEVQKTLIVCERERVSVWGDGWRRRIRQLAIVGAFRETHNASQPSHARKFTLTHSLADMQIWGMCVLHAHRLGPFACARVVQSGAGKNGTPLVNILCANIVTFWPAPSVISVSYTHLIGYIAYHLLFTIPIANCESEIFLY